MPIILVILVTSIINISTTVSIIIIIISSLKYVRKNNSRTVQGRTNGKQNVRTFHHCHSWPYVFSLRLSWSSYNYRYSYNIINIINIIMMTLCMGIYAFMYVCMWYINIFFMCMYVYLFVIAFIYYSISLYLYILFIIYFTEIYIL